MHAFVEMLTVRSSNIDLYARRQRDGSDGGMRREGYVVCFGQRSQSV